MKLAGWEYHFIVANCFFCRSTYPICLVVFLHTRYGLFRFDSYECHICMQSARIVIILWQLTRHSACSLKLQSIHSFILAVSIYVIINDFVWNRERVSYSGNHQLKLCSFFVLGLCIALRSDKAWHVMARGNMVRRHEPRMYSVLRPQLKSIIIWFPLEVFSWCLLH